ncbi:MAG: hypothetical protein DRG78_08645 [Epsilonproteobacteria bacterium]|nr:MAG: hypothetical protein DRG78_08645 [Campylobacterota bacterium]
MVNKELKIIFVLLLGIFTLLQAENKYTKNYSNDTIKVPSSNNSKIFIKEYTYNASDDDSKNSSRKIAIAELKSLLSEEIGVHIQSSFDIKQTSSSKIVKKEIHQLSASITKLKIIEEKWNGITYYIKASVKVNEEQTMFLLLEAIKAKASKKDVDKLTNILKKKNYKITELNKQITLNEFLNEKNKLANKLGVNLGFLMNQKYLCIQQALFIDDTVIEKKDINNKIKFYINSSLVLNTKIGSKLEQKAPQIYANKNTRITLMPIKGYRYLLINKKRESNKSIFMKCTDTKIWNIN